MTECNDIKKQRRHNTGLAKVAVQCSADSFEVVENSVLRMKFSGKNPALRVAAKRYSQCLKNDRANLKLTAKK